MTATQRKHANRANRTIRRYHQAAVDLVTTVLSIAPHPAGCQCPICAARRRVLSAQKQTGLPACRLLERNERNERMEEPL